MLKLKSFFKSLHDGYKTNQRFLKIQCTQHHNLLIKCIISGKYYVIMHSLRQVTVDLKATAGLVYPGMKSRSRLGHISGRLGLGAGRLGSRLGLGFKGLVESLY